jgi:hypothetical protein
MLQFVADGGVDDALASFAQIEEIQEHVRNVIQAYQEGGSRAAMQASVSVAGSIASDGVLESSDVSRLMDTGSMGEMLMNLDLGRLASLAAAASMGGPLAFIAAKAMANRMPKISPNDLVKAYQLANNQEMRDAREQSRARRTNSGERSPEPSKPARTEGGNTATGIPPMVDNELVNAYREAEDPEEESAAPQQSGGAQQPSVQASPSVAPQSPNQIAAELEKQKQEARNQQSPAVLPSDATGIDRTGEQLQRAASALPDEIPQINQLPGQLPANLGDDNPAGLDDAQQESVDQQTQPQTPTQTAAQLDRQKQTARKATEDSEDDEESIDLRGGSKGSSTDPRPGSLLYLDWEFAACVPALFAADFEPLIYIHEHMIGYWMRDIPLLAMYLGFGKHEFEEPQSRHWVLFGIILVIEFGLAAFAIVGILLPFIIAFAPVIIGAATGVTLLDQLLGGSFLGDSGAYNTLIQTIRDLL